MCIVNYDKYYFMVPALVRYVFLMECTKTISPDGMNFWSFCTYCIVLCCIVLLWKDDECWMMKENVKEMGNNYVKTRNLTFVIP